MKRLVPSVAMPIGELKVAAVPVPSVVPVTPTCPAIVDTLAVAMPHLADGGVAIVGDIQARAVRGDSAGKKEPRRRSNAISAAGRSRSCECAHGGGGDDDHADHIVVRVGHIEVPCIVDNPIGRKESAGDT